MHIGLFFGSFNPIHTGHLIIADYMANNTAVDQVWFVVSPQNPFKESSSLLNERLRLNLVELAIAGNAKLKTSDIEFELPRPSYTIDSLTHLHNKYPHYQFSIIAGSDSFFDISKWKSGDLIFNNYSFFIYKRPALSFQTEFKNANILDAPLLDISSTYIRNSIKEGKSVRYLVPAPVLEEIVKREYYK